jgi:hypothetical protein
MPYSQNRDDFDAFIKMTDELQSASRIVGDKSSRDASESVGRRACSQTIASNIRQTTVSAIENVREWKEFSGTVIDVQSPADPLRLPAGTLVFIVYHPEPLTPMKARLVVVVRHLHYWVHCALPMPPNGENAPALNVAIQSTSLRSGVLFEGTPDYVRASDFQVEYDMACPNGPIAHIGQNEGESLDEVRAKVKAENAARRSGPAPRMTKTAVKAPVSTGSVRAPAPAVSHVKGPMQLHPVKLPATLEDAEA